MKIALDYDHTYSADPAFWGGFIRLCEYSGHEIRIVTARDERFDRTEPLEKIEDHIPVIYTRGIAKRWYCEHFVEDFMPDIWIDDRPESILENSTTSPDALALWRKNRDEAPCNGIFEEVEKIVTSRERRLLREARKEADAIKTRTEARLADAMISDMER